MKRLINLLLILMAVATVNAQGWDEALYKQIESRIVAPTFKDKTYNIKKYGASVKANAAKNQKAINAAIAACSKKGGGTVVVPAGTWNTGAIRLQSNVNLRIEKDAVILFAYEPDLYPLVKTRWEGLDIMNYSPCVYAYQAENIAITGEGTLDGNGENDTWWQWCGAKKFGFEKGKTPEAQNGYPYAGPEKYRTKKADGTYRSSRETLLWMADNGIPTEERIFGKGCGMRPQLVNFYECKNILIEDVTMLRSPFWVITPTLSKNITVRKVKVINDGPNGDGCDPESCEDVLIEDCLFDTGDDCIAIKSGRNADGRRTPVPSQNIIVRGCTMADGHGGVVLGSEISAGVRNVFAENCKMDSPNLDRVLRIKTNTCRGGVTENVYMRNIEVGQCREAVLRINLMYEPKEPAERGHIPTVRNVYMENVTCQKSKYGILLNGLDDQDNIYNINVKNCTFNGVTDEKVRRTGKSHDINFDNLRINGELVLSQPPFSHYSEWMAWSEIQRVPKSYFLDFTDPKKRPNGKWSYVMGIELEGIMDAYQAYLNPIFKDYVIEYPQKMITENGEITGYKLSDYNLDNVRTARFILRCNRLFPHKGSDKALQTLFRQLEEQPRTKEGVWWHKAIYANQVWLDGIFMGLPFYTLGAEELRGQKNAKKYYDDAVDQIGKTFKRTYDAKTGLWKHAWDETHTMFWADKETGLSKHTWARAMGWFTMAMVEILDALPENYERRGEVIEMLQQAMTAAVKYQDKKSGVWYDVMDVKDDRNYLEATASSMFTYCLLKGARLGYLPTANNWAAGVKQYPLCEAAKAAGADKIDFKEAGIKAYNGILNNFIKVNDDKTISLTRCCAVSGLGPNKSPNRDGSFEYYMSEPIRDNDAKGIGPFIWASLEMERDGFKAGF
ncbi:MAG: glycoside hydrolase family 88 protein [Prevotellaceae bacterium]|nr:glycoside hydrolase family 88 protein [Prevotellaceae bacterium]MDO4931294.1 glycoside hydrolase family 88 protein [Prevotellaceae bacterium]